jgi:hypothetical protein
VKRDLTKPNVMQGWPSIRESNTAHALSGRALWKVSAELPFEPHRIRLDETGRYDEALDREFPFVVRLFHFRHQDYTPGLTWHERLEIFLPLDALTKMRMGQQEVEFQPGEILIVDNLRLHMRQQERATRLCPVFEYVSKNFAENLTLKQGAALASISQPQSKLFKRVTRDD